MTALEKAKNWIKKSITLKLITITIIMLLLLIPKSMITSLIYERQGLSTKVIKDISAEWANEQTISGPILTIPVIYRYQKKTTDKDGKEDFEYFNETKHLRVLPSKLNIKGHVTPKQRNRGIYKAMLYKSDLNISGTLSIPEIKGDNIHEIKWNDAYITLAISDLRGISNEIKFEFAGDTLTAESGSNISSFESGITMRCTGLQKKSKQKLPFSMHLKLKGSNGLNFIPDGDVTDINITSEWPDPSFSGYVLPDAHNITNSGFTAYWKLLQLNRNYPTSWYGNDHFKSQKKSAFGFSIFKGNDHYQKSLRSVKYGAMIIALNFLVFFIVEVLNKKRIHPFQYILVGMSLVLFFSLLVALSEQIAYNAAYLCSAITTILMVSLYSESVLGTWKLAYLMCATLSGVYIFLYFTLQSTDYALLIGSIGLTAILAASMYFTRNINWYSDNTVVDG